MAESAVRSSPVGEGDRSSVSTTGSFHGSTDSIPLDDSDLAHQGISLLLNNKFKEAKELFETHKNGSPLMHMGSSFVAFMEGLMSFEDERLSVAMKALQETEKRCETNNGFVSSFKRKLSRKKNTTQSQLNLEDKLQRDVIIADTILYQSILTFLNQDIPSYVKGGWLLRKAYKIYDRVHKTVVQLQQKLSDSKIPGRADLTKSAATDGNENELTEDLLSQLLAAVSFGYGTLQLSISLVPPKILKIIEFLGFEGDREAGLSALHYTSNSRDMRAPLAMLGVLWYHTILRPFFALDGTNAAAGVPDAEAVLDAKQKDFNNSSLFLFFRGRVQRMKRETEASLMTYNTALALAADQRELQLMCLYEIGWCHLLRLQWHESLKCFLRLSEESKWSKCYYEYLLAICAGALGDTAGARERFKVVPSLVKRKNNQIEAFVARRSEKLGKTVPSAECMQLLTVELLFLWNAFPTCTEEELRGLLKVCESQTERGVLHLKCLIEGALYRELQDEELATTCLEEAIARHQGMKDDLHVAAFAMFELATIYLKSPQTLPKSKTLLIKIRDNLKDYDFENRLSVRVNNAIKVVEKTLKAQN
ncbi:tetratricopeptide repeat protein 39C-like [Liolophura sinensis]|uniref:tetratricopeptide repeat protein 39C-like n=1 Tax=Liolophura sinensis TaxID=3198878 RepID=UPI00315897D6